MFQGALQAFGWK